MSAEEWFVLRGWSGPDTGMIPRRVVEAMGIDCSPADRPSHMPGTHGTIWFTRDEVDAIHRHREWEPTP